MLILIALAGFGASFVDGALGMGFGVTSSTLLIAVGLTPALASASVHLAKLGTAAASGVAHHKFGNVDWSGVRRIGLPGAVGAFVGATVLSNISAKAALPFTGTLLFLLGVYIVVRFVRGRAPRRKPGVPGLKLMVPLGLVGGFVDATGGGGWGPVTTPTLMADGRLSPARVIGTVNTAEFIVALAASLGFLVGLGTAGIDLGIVLALLAGGVIAAPLAAYLVRHLNARILGVVVGNFICLLNARILLMTLNAPESAWWVTYGVLLAIAAVSITFVVRIVRRDRAHAGAAPEPAEQSPSLTA
ncbi:MAG: permease [Actinomycetales bacterium mxb001]|nr:MAG: permease [Actinomycetales bacterium mxb001]